MQCTGGRHIVGEAALQHSTRTHVISFQLTGFVKHCGTQLEEGEVLYFGGVSQEREEPEAVHNL